MEHNISKAKRNQTSQVITKTYSVKISKSQQGKFKITSEDPKLIDPTPTKQSTPRKTGTYPQSNQKTKKSNENSDNQANNSIIYYKQGAKRLNGPKGGSESYPQVTPAKYKDMKRTYSTPSTQPSGDDSETLRKKPVEGFKIVRNGNIILDLLLNETESDTLSGGVSSGSEVSSSKSICFATSQCNIGPSCNKISLPEFLIGY